METPTTEKVQAPISPLPFVARGIGIMDAEENLICSVDGAEVGVLDDSANAAYLAHAANCYPVLVEALTALVNSPNFKHNAMWERALDALTEAGVAR